MIFTSKTSSIALMQDVKRDYKSSALGRNTFFEDKCAPPKARLSSPAPTKHTSTTLDCKVYGSVFCFLSPFSPVWLVVARNTIRNPIVFQAKIGQISPLDKRLALKVKDFLKIFKIKKIFGTFRRISVIESFLQGRNNNGRKGFNWTN